MELGQFRRLLAGDDFRIALENDLWPGGLVHVRPALEAAVAGSYTGTLSSESLHKLDDGIHAEKNDDAALVSGRWLSIVRSGDDRDGSASQLWYQVPALRMENTRFTAYTHAWREHPPKKARDSLVLISSEGAGRPAILRCIAASSVRLVVQFFKALNVRDRQIDPYCINTVRHAAASLHDRFQACYAELEPPTVMPVTSLVSHIGYTPYSGFSKAAAIATVLTRVSVWTEHVWVLR